MSSGRVPVESQLVVIGEVPSDFAERVAATGASVKEVSGHRDVRLVALGAEKGAQAARLELAALAGGQALVEPVLTDESGAQLLPTGTVRAHFHTPQSEAELRRFARRYGAEFVARNRWRPNIADFRIRPDDPRSVLEVADAVASDGAVENAWPDVLADFRRAPAGT